MQTDAYQEDHDIWPSEPKAIEVEQAKEQVDLRNKQNFCEAPQKGPIMST